MDCDPGYQPLGPALCLGGGWEQVNCEPAHCTGEPPAIPHALAVAHCAFTPAGGDCTIPCLPGYAAVGVAVCDLSHPGTWVGHPTCTPTTSLPSVVQELRTELTVEGVNLGHRSHLRFHMTQLRQGVAQAVGVSTETVLVSLERWEQETWRVYVHVTCVVSCAKAHTALERRSLQDWDKTIKAIVCVDGSECTAVARTVASVTRHESDA